MESALPVSAPFNARFLSHILAIIALAGLAGCGGEPDSVITTSDGNTMILIPAGTFPRGGTEEEVSEVPDKQYISYYAERPISDISLRSFYIDKFEVTTAQYREFLEDTGDGATRWDHADQPEGMNHATRYVTENLAGDVQPAVGINWYDAYAYCGWADKRLPSEAEWEYAARGSTYRIYPWGDHGPHHDDIYFANYRPKAGADADGHRMTAPIGTYPDGVSPFGIMDMAGNAEEWVQDW